MPSGQAPQLPPHPSKPQAVSVAAQEGTHEQTHSFQADPEALQVSVPVAAGWS